MALEPTLASASEVGADTFAQPVFLNPPAPGSAALKVLPHPPFELSPTIGTKGAIVATGTTGTMPTVAAADAGVSLTPEAAASRFSSFSSRLRSFSRALELSFGRWEASISLKRCDRNESV